jgi:hypothetical protein
MLKQFLGALVCSVVFIGKLHAQEVIVAREKKSDVPKPTIPPSEETSSETPTPAPHKKARERKSVPAKLTLEEMRAAGGRAARGSNEPSVPQSTKTHEPDVESVSAPNPTVIETPRPVKKETQVDHKSSTSPSKSRSTNLEGMGPIRPTMMESGREAPSPSPSGR